MRNTTLGVLVGAVMAIGGFGLAVRSQNVLPAEVPIIGMDSGVAMCKAIAENPNRKVAGGEQAGRSDPEQIRKVRGMFADSRYEDIRINGVALMDLAVQMNSVPQDAGQDFGAALVLAGPIMSATAGLAGGCAEHGYMIPTVGAK